MQQNNFDVSPNIIAYIYPPKTGENWLYQMTGAFRVTNPKVSCVVWEGPKIVFRLKVLFDYLLEHSSSRV